MAGDPAKELRGGAKQWGLGAPGWQCQPRNWTVNAERRKKLTDKARGVGEADLLIRLGKEIANGKWWEQDVSVKDWLDPGREGGWERLEDRQAGGQSSEQRPR